MAFFLSSEKRITLNDKIESIAKRKLGNAKKGGWVIDEEDLKREIGATSNDEIKVVHSNGMTFKLRKIIGYSYPEWTPLAFQLLDEDGALVHNFLYMNGGTELENWAFVASGIYGANLWPDAFEFIFREACKDLNLCEEGTNERSHK